MKIQLKRSNQLSGGSAKEPTAAQMEYGELAVNYNTDDPVIFIKDSDDNIVRIAGAGAEAGGVPNGGTGDRPTGPNVGDLFYDIDLNSILYWDGFQWVALGTNTIVQENPPSTNYAEGTLWFNGSDDEAALYILYDDPTPAAGKKWVQIAGGGFDVGELDNYVLKQGDNMTGALTIGPGGGPAVTTLADDGSIVSGDDSSESNKYARIKHSLSPQIKLNDPGDATKGTSILFGASMVMQCNPARTTADDAIIDIHPSDAPSDPQFRLGADGSATFAGGHTSNKGTTIGPGGFYFRNDDANKTETGLTLVSGGSGTNNVTVKINNNGSATFAGDVVTGISDRFTDGAGGTLSKGAVRVQRGSGAGASSNFFEGYYGVSSPGTKDSMTARISMDGSAEFSGTITAGNYDINSDAGEGSRILPSGLIRAQRPSSADGSSLEVFSGFWGQETTSKIFANGSAVFASDVRIADDPAIGSSTSGIKFYSSGLIRIKHERAATSPMIYDNNGSGNTTFNIRSGGQILLSDTDASGAATSSIFLDGQVGSGTFMNFANADLGNRYGVKIYKEGNAGQERGQVHLDCTNASITSAKVLRIRRGSTVTWSVTASGTVGTRGIELELEPDNPANYTTTTVDGEETQVYSGPTLDVKERLQNLIARIDAIEANEVIDDATDSTLLLAIQALTQRLDERDAIIADLQARITTLEA